MSNVAAILLAAGESTRMGRSKPLLPWLRGQTLIACQTIALHEAGFSPVIVVLGHEAGQVRLAVPKLPGVTVVEHSHYRDGRATSVVRGVQALPTDAAGVMILNVDSPRPTALLRLLKAAFESSQPALAVLAHQGQAGHPWLFSASLLAEFPTITEERQGLREVEERHRNEWLLIEAGSPLALTNINTNEEYEAALATAQESGNPS
jgi:molybdenum cofactor cytidylyltransferase